MGPLCPNGNNMNKLICTYCNKEAWGQYLKFKKSKPYHTFCIKKKANSLRRYRMPGSVTQ